MTVKELMERVGTTKFGFIKAYLQDGSREIESIIEESVAFVQIDITKDKRFYGATESEMPGLVKIMDVSILDTTSGEYTKIPRMVNPSSIDKNME